MSPGIQSTLKQLQVNNYGSREHVHLWSMEISSSLTVVVIFVTAVSYDYCKPCFSIFSPIVLE